MSAGQVWHFVPERRDMRVLEVGDVRHPTSGRLSRAVVFEPLEGCGRDWWNIPESWNRYWRRVR